MLNSNNKHRANTVGGYESSKLIKLIDGYSRSAGCCSSLNALIFDFIRSESIQAMDKARRESIFPEKRLAIEEIIVRTNCCWNFLEKRMHTMVNLTILRDIVNDWKSKRNFADCRENVIEPIKWCIKRDDIDTFRVMLSYFYWGEIYSQTNDGIIQFVNIASEYGSLNCITLLLDAKIDWSKESKPICLLNAVKNHHSNSKFIKFVFDKLFAADTSFECDELMEYIISFDLVYAAGGLIEHKWHQLSEENKLQAQILGLRCNELFNEMSKEFSSYSENDAAVLDDEDDDWKNNVVEID